MARNRFLPGNREDRLLGQDHPKISSQDFIPGIDADRGTVPAIRDGSWSNFVSFQHQELPDFEFSCACFPGEEFEFDEYSWFNDLMDQIQYRTAGLFSGEDQGESNEPDGISSSPSTAYGETSTTVTIGSLLKLDLLQNSNQQEIIFDEYSLSQ